MKLLFHMAKVSHQVYHPTWKIEMFIIRMWRDMTWHDTTLHDVSLLFISGEELLHDKVATVRTKSLIIHIYSHLQDGQLKWWTPWNVYNGAFGELFTQMQALLSTPMPLRNEELNSVTLIKDISVITFLTTAGGCGTASPTSSSDPLPPPPSSFSSPPSWLELPSPLPRDLSLSSSL